MRDGLIVLASASGSHRLTAATTATTKIETKLRSPYLAFKDVPLDEPHICFGGQKLGEGVQNQGCCHTLWVLSRTRASRLRRVNRMWSRS